MYLICRGEAEVIDGEGRVKALLRDGDCFGEVALLLCEPRNATVRATTPCNLFVLERNDFSRILRDHVRFAKTIIEIAGARYNTTVSAENLLAQHSNT
jgi:CRP-like cAMP-binding protein